MAIPSTVPNEVLPVKVTFMSRMLLPSTYIPPPRDLPIHVAELLRTVVFEIEVDPPAWFIKMPPPSRPEVLLLTSQSHMYIDLAVSMAPLSFVASLRRKIESRTDRTILERIAPPSLVRAEFHKKLDPVIVPRTTPSLSGISEYSKPRAPPCKLAEL